MTIRWDILIYALIIGSGMSVFLAVALREFQKHEKQAALPVVFALVLVSAGFILKCAQFGRPERIFRVLSNPSSTIAMELILTAVTIVLMIVYIVISLRSSSGALRIPTALFGIIITLLAIACSGAVYYLPARPAWHTITLPMIYVLSALSVGLPLASLLSYENWGERIFQMLGLAFVVSILCYVFSVYSAPFPDASRSVSRLLKGDLSVMFYVGILCAFIPVILLQVKKLNKFILILILISNVVAAILIRASVYALGTSIQQYIY